MKGNSVMMLSMAIMAMATIVRTSDKLHDQSSAGIWATFTTKLLTQIAEETVESVLLKLENLHLQNTLLNIEEDSTQYSIITSLAMVKELEFWKGDLDLQI